MNATNNRTVYGTIGYPKIKTTAHDVHIRKEVCKMIER